MAFKPFSHSNNFSYNYSKVDISYDVSDEFKFKLGLLHKVPLNNGHHRESS